MTGQDRERELAKALDEAGYSVMRSPASGSVDRDQPDLLYARGGDVIALEMKYTGSNTAYFDADEVDALRRFASDFDAGVRLCVRWKQDTNFYLANGSDARRTPEGNYAIDQEMNLPTVL